MKLKTEFWNGRLLLSSDGEEV